MNVSSVGNAAQEAMETAAQTRAEAAHGDTQASRKLARLARSPAASKDDSTPAAQAIQNAPSTAAATQAGPSVPPDSTGTVLNEKA